MDWAAGTGGSCAAGGLRRRARSCAGATYHPLTAAQGHVSGNPHGHGKCGIDGRRTTGGDGAANRDADEDTWPVSDTTRYGSRTHGDLESLTHGDPNSLAHGDLESLAHGDPNSFAHGDPNSFAHGDLESLTHGDPNSFAHGDPNSLAHGDPNSSFAHSDPNSATDRDPGANGDANSVTHAIASSRCRLFKRCCSGGASE